VLEGNIPLFAPTGFGAGIDYTAFGVNSSGLTEAGVLAGYMHQLEGTPILVGAEVVAGLSSDRAAGWGATQMVTAEIGGTYSRGTMDSWLTGGQSFDLLMRGGLSAGNRFAVFAIGGVGIDNHGLALSYERSGPNTAGPGYVLTPVPGVTSTVQVNYEPTFRIRPVVGLSGEVEIAPGWRARADYLVRWADAENVTLQVVRQSNSPAYPVTSDTGVMAVNGYLMHAFRLGIVRSFSP
jgi:hypothetical protein